MHTRMPVFFASGRSPKGIIQPSCDKFGGRRNTGGFTPMAIQEWNARSNYNGASEGQISERDDNLAKL